jgi:peptidoglycan/LPS O-acetylase OafA/YrhL
MENQSKSRIPSLDGLRALSILMVVFGHAFHIKFIDIANLGVRIFFVISAYLIVGMLLRDVEKNKFSIKTFYFKRFSRTFPAFYAYLLILYFVLSYFNLFEWSQFWRATVYLENYHPRSHWNSNQWFVGHTWSLAVEEQFYVLIALLFYFFNKKSINKHQVTLILIFVVLIIPLIRVSYLFIPQIPNLLRGSIHRSFETVADSLAIGGILAVSVQEILRSKIYIYFKYKIFLLLLMIFSFQFLNSPVLTSLFGLKLRYFYNLFGLTVIHSSIGLLILILMNNPASSVFSRFLNNSIMIKIGLWSYSIYLWQQVWLYNWNLPILIKVLGLFACAICSYYLIELKFLSWRDSQLKKYETN